ncbi:hypothetical protein AMS68_000240 [Peltaster fructicola]|uniref:Uncharacterized protein n=1 Tax=Peltaster fructicola TaxID=286661 RepID=A0A6H0XJ19_9PEZI|nr:hypothetical protein AMS68_000240 [Peltaster fructicola]
MRAPADADEFIAALTSLLKTVLRMSGRPEADLHIPDGIEVDLHPEQAAVLPTKKAPEVVQLLKRMPHVEQGWGFPLAPSTPLMNYWDDPNEAMWPYQSWHPKPAEDSNEKDPSAVVASTELPIAGSGDPYSHTVILELSGPQITARVHSNVYQVPCTVHGSSDQCPLFCQHQSGVQHVPAVQLLRDWEQKFLAAEFMPNPYGEGAVSQDEINDEDWRNRMKTVFLAHGWPGRDFNPDKVNEIVTAEGFMEDWCTFSSEEEDSDD